jgi:hypothetical protein
MTYWTNRDSMRGLVLLGYVAARAADLQFDRAALIAVIGIAGMAIFHWMEQYLISRKR